jgi:AmmeMemoRadiSam system protein B/AmmeMemoRadiSam system protein A
MSGILFSIALTGFHETLLNAADLKTRAAGVAGSFYPSDPGALSAMVDDYLAKAALPRIDGPILAVVAPHAGYEYSGPVAAYTYAALKGRKYARVVVIAPSHFEAFGFTSVYDGDAYLTPLGTVNVDKVFARQLAGMQSSLKLSDRGHTPTGRDAEHAIEVQLPWLQHVLGEFALVPVIMGDQSYEASRDLGVSLAKILANESEGATLIVASSDLSHYHTYADADKLDHKTLNALQTWDYFSMSRNFEERVWEACGGAPIVAAMIAAEREGANQALLLRYANSGDVTGDKSRVVGYAAVGLVKQPKQQAIEQTFSLSSSEKDELIALARTSVEQAIREHKAYEPPAPADEALNRESGAFVTLKESGSLRGCIGYTSASKPLYQTVRDTATLAALRDPRFPPVSGQELAKLEYEISVLSPLRRVRDVREIHVGRHGLLVKNGDREGLLLPQVPTEHHWDRARFLEQTCVKAGMPEQCWKEEGTDIFGFTAEVFGEHPASASK